MNVYTGGLGGKLKLKNIIALGILSGVSLMGDGGAASVKVAKPYVPVFPSVYAPVAAEQSVEPYRMRGGLINRTGSAIDGVESMETSSERKKSLQDIGINVDKD